MVVLIGALGWKVDEAFQSKSTALTVVASAASAKQAGTPDTTSGAYENIQGTSDLATLAADPYGPSQITDNTARTLAAQYAQIQKNGAMTSAQKTQAAQDLGATLKAHITYTAYTASNIKTDTDTSYARMLTYRGALQTSLAPLLDNTTPELDLLTGYIQTKDPHYLTQLQKAAATYKLVAVKTAHILVPTDAVNIHIGILNAMQQFAATLTQMVASADDPFVEATLLNTYMASQQEMFSSFNDLYGYYKSKQS